MKTNIKEVISEYRDLKENVFYPYDMKNGDTEFIIKQKENVKNKFEQLVEYINKNSGQETINYYRKNLLQSLDFLLQVTKKSKAGFPLDRNQALVVDNYIFGKIIYVIKNAISIGVSRPDFYYNIEGDFDEGPLRLVLENFKKDLNSKKFENFFELEKFTENTIQKIREMWEAENEKISAKVH